MRMPLAFLKRLSKKCLSHAWVTMWSRDELPDTSHVQGGFVVWARDGKI